MTSTWKLERMSPTLTVVSFLLIIASCTGHSQMAHADDPLNLPLDSVGVSGYDRTLCSDKWNECSSYDRQQFDTRYPGSALDDISLYPLSYAGDDGIGDGLSGLTDTETQGAISKAQTLRSARMEKDAPRDAWERRRWLEKKVEADRSRNRRWETPQENLRSPVRPSGPAISSTLPSAVHQYGGPR